MESWDVANCVNPKCSGDQNPLKLLEMSADFPAVSAQ